MDSLGPRIKELRLEANLNKAALARRVGVSDVTISYWESGAIKQIGHERLVALAEALGCPLSRLIEGESSGRAKPLYLRSDPPAPWQDPGAGRIEMPFELVPAQEWEGDCFLLTPVPGETFDFIAAGDLVAVAPTEIFRQTGLYLVEREGRHCIRRVSQGPTGELQFQAEESDEVVGYTPDTRLLGKLVARWRAEAL
ncbi:transcriptional regulator with XRE-family HTH domain [Halomonas campaniensis]|jgi:transcriptional regulator with XRE-family HTH domain|uniref:Transcriptional regulator with XRE-family HTH domain n=1 Tax=Halomonas campaniensis TaxID=213554 RepID=A0A7W5PA25_9GAMM|nr:MULTISPECIES: helix-turn-helix transcriptional regulator [Halomonas]MBB3330319.1 transcriptional regulator with XRE-family HTH domain [Halomonas campaniensis]